MLDHGELCSKKVVGEHTVLGGIVTTKVNSRKLGKKDTLELKVEIGQPNALLNGESVAVKNIKVSVDAFARCLCNGEVLSKAMKVPADGTIGLQAERGKFEFRRFE